jgi:hypothetical protein
MKILDYVFVSSDETTTTSSDAYCKIFINAKNSLEVIEETIDLSLMDFLHEPVEIIFSSNKDHEHLARLLAKKYDVKYQLVE